MSSGVGRKFLHLRHLRALGEGSFLHLLPLWLGLRLGFPWIWDQAKADEAVASGTNPGTEIENECRIEKKFFKNK